MDKIEVVTNVGDVPIKTDSKWPTAHYAKQSHAKSLQFLSLFAQHTKTISEL